MNKLQKFVNSPLLVSDKRLLSRNSWVNEIDQVGDCIGYVRTSTIGQASSAERQEAAIARKAKEVGRRLKAICFDHGFTGDIEANKRLGFVEALRRIERGDVLIAESSDRLTRAGVRDGNWIREVVAGSRATIEFVYNHRYEIDFAENLRLLVLDEFENNRSNREAIHYAKLSRYI